MIKVKNLVKSYQKNVILDNITFEVQSGDVVGIIGMSGCGKSTLLRCLNGLEKIDTGSILIDSLELNKKNLVDIRKKTGMVFQQFNLFEHLTVLENLTLAPMKVKKLCKKEAIELSMELLNRVDLSDKANFYPHQLSGGQSQRVAIARALAMRPQIMLFDEPTSALDPKMTKEVLDVMADLKNDKMTMLIVSHELKFLRSITNKILFMCNNRIEENANTIEFFNNPKSIVAKEFLSNITNLKE